MPPPVVLVHGAPETSDIWAPLQAELDRETVALGLPGFGTPRPSDFTATKDAYADWLTAELRRFETPVDLVGHDFGALLTMRVVSGFDVPVRSWAADVGPIFHPDFVWPERVRKLEEPARGERAVARLVGAGVPPDLAETIAARHDAQMSRSILDFYRSAQPNVAADWWADAVARAPRGLLLLLPDPPQEEAMSIEVAERLGAETARLDALEHCWMAQEPAAAAAVLERFWATL